MSPEALEIRRYLNACLPGHLDNSEDAHRHMPTAKRIDHQRASSIRCVGTFRSDLGPTFDYGGQVFTVLFTIHRTKEVYIWVFILEEIHPDVRSFLCKWFSEERLYLVNDLGAYLTDTRFH